MKPSDFTSYPWDCVLNVAHKAENEMIAQNIMIILKRTGNEFRPLTWDEYKTERLKDKGFSDIEKGYFDAVIEWCKNSDTAQLFSKSWKKKETA